MYRKTYVEINTTIIENNVKNILKKYNDYKYYIGVVKGNAYGHGMEVAKYLLNSGINYLAVSTLDEALEIRKKVSNDCPILILQPVDLEYIDICSKENITITISSYDYYLKLKNMNIDNLKVHIKIDSGMNRLGLNNKEQVNNIYNELINSNNIILEGIYTHLGTLGIIDTRFDNQVERFKKITEDIDLSKIEIVHIYSSNAVVIHPKLSFTNGCRLGIIMYGLAPRNFNNNGLKNKLRKIKRDMTRKKLHLSPINEDFSIDVKPAFRLVSEVNEIKEVNANEYISYGFSYKTDSKCKVAIVHTGYMDGLSLNHKGRNVYINDKQYPIVGVVNMGMLVIKIDDTVKVGDRVDVIRNIRSEAGYVKTSPHQLMTSVSPFLERKYIEEEG